MEQIFRKLKQKKIQFSHVCEVGVFTPEYSNIQDFIKAGVRSTIVEANPELVEQLKIYFKDAKNITIHSYAMWDYNGFVILAKAEASSFVTDLKSTPALANDKYKINDSNTVKVDCRMFSEIDDGTIDLISVDIEGSEWYVLKHMISRPKIISIETHGRHYTNPFLKNILEWMSKNNYRIWYKNVSDTVFVRNDVFKQNIQDSVTLKVSEGALALQKIKRSLTK